jgi:putative MATE family efflux protein
MIGVLPHQISFGVNSFIRGEGNPKIAMATLLIGGILNVILDYIFIALLGYGMKGAAWATAIGYSVSAVWVLHYYLSGRSFVKFSFANCNMKLESVKQVLLMGSPHFIMHLISSVQMSLFNNQLTRHGNTTSISIMGVLMSFNLIWLMPVIGVSQGLQPIAGYNYGAKNPERVRKALILAIGAATAICLFFYMIVGFFPRFIFSLFTSDSNSAFVVAGADAIGRFLYLLPCVGYLIISGNYFQFTGRPKFSLALTIFRQVVFLIPALIVLPRYFGLNGVWYAMPFADIGALILTTIFMFKELRALKSSTWQQVNSKNPR